MHCSILIYHGIQWNLQMIFELILDHLALNSLKRWCFLQGNKQESEGIHHHGRLAPGSARLFQSTAAWSPSFDSILKAVPLNSSVEGLRPMSTIKRQCHFFTGFQVNKKERMDLSKRGITHGIYLKKKQGFGKTVFKLSLIPITYRQPLIKAQRFIWTHLSLKSTTPNQKISRLHQLSMLWFVINHVSPKWWFTADFPW